MFVPGFSSSLCHVHPQYFFRSKPHDLLLLTNNDNMPRPAGNMWPIFQALELAGLFMDIMVEGRFFYITLIREETLSTGQQNSFAQRTNLLYKPSILTFYSSLQLWCKHLSSLFPISPSPVEPTSRENQTTALLVTYRANGRKTTT